MSIESTDSILTLRNISKSFGPVKALENVNLEVRRGEVHALIGENGAGKSTLMKILSGAYQPDSGSITFCGSDYKVANPAAGRSAGIAMIYQELTLAPHLSVEENIALGVEKSRFGFRTPDFRKVRDVLSWMGHSDLDCEQAVGALSISLKQVVEIARALYVDARLIVMDEPTSSLSGADSKRLFEVVGKLRERGISVIYISHFLEEVQEICDRYTVLRDGHTVATGDIPGTTISFLIEKMVGRSLREVYRRGGHALGETAIEVKDLEGKTLPRGVSFHLRKGEILGIAGLVGSGRSETVRSLFGLTNAERGTVLLRDHDRKAARSLTPRRALDRGINLLSENRKEEGLAQSLSIGENITLSALDRYQTGGFLRPAMEHRSAQEWCRTMGVKYHDISAPVGSLSGGNQQKVALARMLHHDSDILLLDEPTKGIDVGSKVEIYERINELAARGKAIVVVSSYLPELIGICDSIAVMYRGMMSEVRPVAEWSEQKIMLYATSGS